MMQIDRRQFLVASAGWISGSKFAFAETSADGFQVLRANNQTMNLLGDGTTKTKVWRWGDEAGATIVRAKQGQELRLRLINELDTEIWLHFFGVRGPSEMMTLNIPAKDGNSVDCIFTPPDAGTFWFGPFLDASRHRDMGLYGALIVEEAEALPTIVDVPIVLDDWALDEAGQILGDFGNLQAAVGEGRLGNWFTVNGALKPKIKLDRGKLARLRIVNCSNVRSFGLLFKGADPWILALDGQPTPLKHVGNVAMLLAPGQRADVLLEPESDQIVLALDLFEDIVEIGVLEWEGARVENQLPDNFTLASNPITKVEQTETSIRHEIVLAGGAKGGLKSARVGSEDLDMRGLLERGLAWAMNGIAGVGGPPLFTAKLGETIVLAFDNRTTFPQPLHIHGHVWRLISQDGVVKDEQPWRDTGLVPGLAKAEFILAADNPDTWAIQSSIAERSDAGLLGSFVVTAE